MSRISIVVTALVLSFADLGATQGHSDPLLDAVLAKIAAYVARYGEHTSLVVAVEKYTQSVTLDGRAAPSKPRQLVAEFAIVKAAGGAWTGFRDVVEVDGQKIANRRDRLVSLLTDTSTDSSEVTRIANESARFNIGPISRNFNVPTTALLFFTPANLSRFTFRLKGTKNIDGVRTWEIGFAETRSPTFIRTRAGADVPIEGALWARPDDGTVVRTRLLMRNFADQMTSPEQSDPKQRPAVNPNTPTGGREALARAEAIPTLEWRRIDSSAEIEVTYRQDGTSGLWLPSAMAELYVGPITVTTRPSVGRATTRATYSDFKQFGTAVKINVPK